MIVKENLNFQDCKEALFFLKSKIEVRGDIKIYLEVNEFVGDELLQEIGLKFKENIKKIAIVCRDESIENMRIIARKFYRSEIKFFEVIEKAQAKRWVHLKA
ncbi:STAS/SEC14 domain-containing protein [Gramella sp. AN32]|uniref:STAS/SEC14 domain-containing protein n=1 Tax=Christiangramia antarctica TaxID=2058158 RepID=A0ABW5X430_9FLAO|nr:STAS/SEC14 domain-containing protein [Gramella sp. AN32]MCM4156420.1 hypothetical protein [Gramella sp. AN32]